MSEEHQEVMISFKPHKKTVRNILSVFGTIAKVQNEAQRYKITCPKARYAVIMAWTMVVNADVNPLPHFPVFMFSLMPSVTDKVSKSPRLPGHTPWLSFPSSLAVKPGPVMDPNLCN